MCVCDECDEGGASLVTLRCGEMCHPCLPPAEVVDLGRLVRGKLTSELEAVDAVEWGARVAV